MEATVTKPELNEVVAKTHTLAPGTPAVFEHHTLGVFDIRTITPAQVDALAEAGSKIFIQKAADKAPKAAGA